MPAIPEEDATDSNDSNSISNSNSTAGSSRRRHSSSVLIKTAAQLIAENSGGTLDVAEAELLVRVSCSLHAYYQHLYMLLYYLEPMFVFCA
jgi:hypothetical protein